MLTCFLHVNETPWTIVIHISSRTPNDALPFVCHIVAVVFAVTLTDAKLLIPGPNLYPINEASGMDSWIFAMNWHAGLENDSIFHVAVWKRQLNWF